MEWRDWEPVYAEILRDFGYSRAADETARDTLLGLTSESAPVDLEALRARFAGQEVTIAGPLARAIPFGPLIASDAAPWAFAHADALVTDLDGDVDAQVDANRRGVPVFLHAHGDNMEKLREHAHRFTGPLQPTTQAASNGRVLDLGGFTDGDRAACLAAHLGARSLVLAGFDFDAPHPKPGRDPETKRRKLQWARRIIASLGIPTRIT